MRAHLAALVALAHLTSAAGDYVDIDGYTRIEGAACLPIDFSSCDNVWPPPFPLDAASTYTDFNSPTEDKVGIRPGEGGTDFTGGTRDPVACAALCDAEPLCARPSM